MLEKAISDYLCNYTEPFVYVIIPGYIAALNPLKHIFCEKTIQVIQTRLESLVTLTNTVTCFTYVRFTHVKPIC